MWVLNFEFPSRTCKPFSDILLNGFPSLRKRGSRKDLAENRLPTSQGFPGSGIEPRSTQRHRFQSPLWLFGPEHIGAILGGGFHSCPEFWFGSLLAHYLDCLLSWAVDWQAVTFADSLTVWWLACSIECRLAIYVKLLGSLVVWRLACWLIVWLNCWSASCFGFFAWSTLWHDKKKELSSFYDNCTNYRIDLISGNSEKLIWSVCGRYVVGTWSVRGRYVVCMWSVRGRYVVGMWLPLSQWWRMTYDVRICRCVVFSKAAFFWDYSVYSYFGIGITECTEYQFPIKQIARYSENRIYSWRNQKRPARMRNFPAKIIFRPFCYREQNERNSIPFIPE